MPDPTGPTDPTPTAPAPDFAASVAALIAAEEALAAATAAYHAAKARAVADLAAAGRDRGNPAVAAGHLAWREGDDVRRVKLPATA